MTTDLDQPGSPATTPTRATRCSPRTGGWWPTTARRSPTPCSTPTAAEPPILLANGWSCSDAYWVDLRPPLPRAGTPVRAARHAWPRDVRASPATRAAAPGTCRRGRRHPPPRRRPPRRPRRRGHRPGRARGPLDGRADVARGLPPAARALPRAGADRRHLREPVPRRCYGTSDRRPRLPAWPAPRCAGCPRS